MKNSLLDHRECFLSLLRTAERIASQDKEAHRMTQAFCKHTVLCKIGSGGEMFSRNSSNVPRPHVNLVIIRPEEAQWFSEFPESDLFFRSPDIIVLRYLSQWRLPIFAIALIHEIVHWHDYVTRVNPFFEIGFTEVDIAKDEIRAHTLESRLLNKYFQKRWTNLIQLIVNGDGFSVKYNGFKVPSNHGWRNFAQLISANLIGEQEKQSLTASFVIDLLLFQCRDDDQKLKAYAYAMSYIKSECAIQNA